MSDEDDWGSGGGDENAANGGGDDDWGAMNDDDNAQWDGDQPVADDSSEQSVDVQISNIFYEAEDLVKDDPQTALTKFEAVLTLGGSSLNPSTSSNLSDDSKTAVFSSLVHLVKLLFHLGRLDEMITKYIQLLSAIPRVTRNESSDAIDSILNLVTHSKNNTFLEKVYKLTSDTLSTMPDTERMLFNVQMKLAKSSMEKADYEAVKKTLSALLKSCQTIDGIDDKKNKGSELIEIYALEIKMALATNNMNTMKHLYDKTKDLTAAVKDPRSQSIIRESWGKMFGTEHDWKNAYTEFFSAFVHYQEIGQSDKAKQALKYVIIANMLSGSLQNPFDAREARVYQSDPEISSLSKLRQAYEKCDVNQFNDCMNSLDALPDNFIQTHLQDMIRDFRLRATLQKVRSYRRVKIEFIANELKIHKHEAENILVQLILDGEIAGKIDQLTGVLDLTANVGGEGRKYAALDAWSRALEKLTNNVTRVQLPGAH